MKQSSLSLSHFTAEPLTAGIAAALSGVLFVSATFAAGPASASGLILGVFASGGLGWLVAERCRRSAAHSAALSSGRFPALPQIYRELVSELVESGSHPDPVFRELVGAQLALLSEQVRGWSHGRLTFAGTEAWRTAYEKVLTAPEITEYRSVAWLKSGDYWQDLPGRQGMQLNFELLDRGVRIERLLILGWNLWPPELRVPHGSIRRWIDEQYYRGVSMLLVRECDLIGEQDLLRDFGIYGERAVGELHIDDSSRTVSFTLSFDPAALAWAKEQWARLRLFSRPYDEMVDHSPASR